MANSDVTDVTREFCFGAPGARWHKMKGVRVIGADPSRNKQLPLHSGLDIGNMQSARRLVQIATYLYLLAFELLGFCPGHRSGRFRCQSSERTCHRISLLFPCRIQQPGTIQGPSPVPHRIDRMSMGWFAPGWFAPGCQMGLPPGSKLRARSNSGWFDRWFGQTPQAT